MTPSIYFIFGIIVGGLGVWLFIRQAQSKHSDILQNVRMSGKSSVSDAGAPAGVLAAAEDKEDSLIERQQKEKEKNKERILEILRTQTPLTNNKIEEFLGVSDATATRYLEELEKEGKIRQVGKTGRYVYYERA